MGLSEKIMQYETTKDDNLSSRLVGRGGMHDVSDMSHLKFKIAVLENLLSIQQPKSP